MHLDFTISLGQIGIIAVLCGIFVRVNRVVWEHDLMWLDYAVAHNLPTRRVRSAEKARGAAAG